MAKFKVCGNCLNKGKDPFCYKCNRNRYGYIKKNNCRYCQNTGLFPFCPKCNRDENGKLPKEEPEDRFIKIKRESKEEAQQLLGLMKKNLDKLNLDSNGLVDFGLIEE